jgi:hypothetical protein
LVPLRRNSYILFERLLFRGIGQSPISRPVSFLGTAHISSASCRKLSWSLLRICILHIYEYRSSFDEAWQPYIDDSYTHAQETMALGHYQLLSSIYMACLMMTRWTSELDGFIPTSTAVSNELHAHSCADQILISRRSSHPWGWNSPWD